MTSIKIEESDQESDSCLLKQPKANGSSNGNSPNGGGGTDLTLSSILNHIAYVNQNSYDNCGLGLKTNRKTQIQNVLRMTNATAILGILICILDIVRIF